MHRFYLTCAVIGGTLFVLQWAISLLGMDAHHDADSSGGAVHSHDGVFWGIISFRAIVAALTAFGLAGLATDAMGQPRPITLSAALLFGVAAAMLVAVFLRSLNKLGADGTIRLADAVGSAGVVYLNIPGHAKGVGKVHLNLQNRTVETEALTYGNALPTGTRVTVTQVIAPGTIEVIAIPEMGTLYEKPDSAPPARTT
ncbi:MAG TPA: hypothetical protein VF624_06635 [Tepidisphaeraceae bacterium]|jgi:hypothetical protein